MPELLWLPHFSCFCPKSHFWTNSYLDSNHSQGGINLPHEFHLYLIIYLYILKWFNILYHQLCTGSEFITRKSLLIKSKCSFFQWKLLEAKRLLSLLNPSHVYFSEVRYSDDPQFIELKINILFEFEFQVSCGMQALHGLCSSRPNEKSFPSELNAQLVRFIFKSSSFFVGAFW